MTRSRALVGALAVAGGLWACGDETPVEPEETVGDFAQVACPQFSLSTTAGQPLDEVSIGSLPGSFAAPFAAAMLDDQEEVLGFAYVTEGEGGALQFTVPLHPGEPLEGGEVALAFTDGSRACPLVSFTIEALPAADGELESVVDLLQVYVEEQAAVYGATVEELIEAPIDEMSSQLWPLAMAQALLDHPSNTASLRSIVEGVDQGERREWMNRLLATMGVRAELETAAAAPGIARGAPARGPSGGAARSVEGLLCAPDFVETAEQLDFCMEKAAEAAAAATGLSRQVAQDIQKAFANLESAKVPLAGEVKAIFGAMFWIIYTQREQAAALLPSQFTAMTVTADGDRILEDDEEPSMLAAEVYATSLGYDLQQQLLDGINEAMGLVQSTGKFELSTGTALDDVAAKIGPEFKRRLGDLDIEDLDLEPELFGPVPIDAPEWLDSRIVSGSSVEQVDDVSYRGMEVGTTTVSVRTQDGEFGGAQIAEQVGIEVVPIQVSISPTEVVIEPEDARSFDVTVTNAKYPDRVAIDPSVALQGEAEMTIGDGGSHFVTYVAPASPNYEQVDLLTVEYTGETGARASNPVPRRAVSVIRFGGLQLAPVTRCLGPGDEEQLEVVVTIPGDPELVWTASAGEVDDEGLFTAPDEPGTVVITVALASDSTVNDSIEFEVGGCVCSFTFQAGSNPEYTAQVGDTVQFTAYSDRVVAVSMTRGEAENVFFSVDNEATLVTGPGDWPLDAIYGNLGYGSPYGETNLEEGMVGTLTVDEFTPYSVLTGSMSGTVRPEGDPDQPAMSVSGTFQIYPTSSALFYYSCAVQ